MFGEKDAGQILRRFKVVSMADLPPAPPKQKRNAEDDTNSEEILQRRFSNRELLSTYDKN